jgi:GT2 family glycosyltransferase
MPWLRTVGSNTYDQPGETNTLTGCNFSVSAETARRVGPFDTNFTGVVCKEDADYGTRCHRSGARMVFDPAAVLMHHREAAGGVDANIREIARMYELSLLRNELYFARKHFAAPIVWLYKLRMLRRLRRARRNSGQAPPVPARQLVGRADREAKQLLR